MTNTDALLALADKVKACPICKGDARIKVGWYPVNNIKIKVEYDQCPECQPPPHSFYAKQTADHIRALIAEGRE